MKRLILLLWVCGYSLGMSGQNDKIQKAVSDLFLGFNVNEKPAKIEYESRMAICQWGTTITEKNNTSFTTHPIFKGDIKGHYNVTYLYDRVYHTDLFDKYGMYHLYMEVIFKNYNDCKRALDDIKKRFKDDSFRITTEYGRENEPKSQTITCLTYPELPLPRIVTQFKRGPYRITIDVYTSWDFKKFRGFKDHLFD